VKEKEKKTLLSSIGERRERESGDKSSHPGELTLLHFFLIKTNKN
jgi:hypothetical protein